MLKHIAYVLLWIVGYCIYWVVLPGRPIRDGDLKLLTGIGDKGHMIRLNTYDDFVAVSATAAEIANLIKGTETRSRKNMYSKI